MFFWNSQFSNLIPVFSFSLYYYFFLIYFPKFIYINFFVGVLTQKFRVSGKHVRFVLVCLVCRQYSIDVVVGCFYDS